MLVARWFPYRLDFSFTAVTSRQSMRHKDTYFVVIQDAINPELKGIGECALFKGLGDDDTPLYESRLDYWCKNINSITDTGLIKETSIRFGVETALRDLLGGGKRLLWDTPWSAGEGTLTVNGLVWMGDIPTMIRRMEEKMAAGFSCIKIKVGACDFDKELELLAKVREMSRDVELRLDANGALSPRDALFKIEKLARYDIHSIEQPIRAGQWREMKEITRNSAIPVALDEELIGCSDYDYRCRLLDATMPQYVILKPSLCGGFSGADGWIKDAVDREAGWWATSALESNIGLNAIAQWVSAKNPSIPQGLGTGMLYNNNIASPLYLEGEQLKYNVNEGWNLKLFDEK